MTQTVLYTNPQSRGRIARWMLEEVGIPYEVEVMTYGGNMHGDAYRSINPMGKVPALAHEGRVITEAAAICAYLAEAVPQAGLGPRPDERADYFRWLFFAAGPAEAAITNRSMGWDPEGPKRGMFGYGHFALMQETLAGAVSRHPYITGQRFTAADVYVGSQVGYGLMFGTLEARPAFTEYWQRLSQRPAKLRADALDDALASGS